MEDSIVRVFEYKGQWILATRKFFINDKERSRILTALRSHLNIEVVQQLEFLLDEGNVYFFQVREKEDGTSGLFIADVYDLSSGSYLEINKMKDVALAISLTKAKTDFFKTLEQAASTAFKAPAGQGVYVLAGGKRFFFASSLKKAEVVANLK